MSSLALLSECDLSLDSIPFLTQQLFYLVQGEHSLTSQHQQSQEEEDEIDDRHKSLPLPPPSQISQKLWRTLHRLPLRESYRKKVLESVHTHHEFWGAACAHSEEGESVVKNISNLPWKSQEGGVDDDMCGLDDYVLLRCLSEEAYLESVNERATALTNSVSVPLLADLLTGTTCSCLLFYNEACPRTQAVLPSLEDDIRRTINVSS